MMDRDGRFEGKGRPGRICGVDGIAPRRRAGSTGVGAVAAVLAAVLARAGSRAAVCLLVACAVLAALPGAALAQTEVPRDWPLIPTGLGGGDEFRLIFVSSTERDATSSDIGDYNAFVQGRAAAGHTDIRAYSSAFRVVGSTAAVHARDNTATTGAGVPIYWLNGAKVADGYAGFYDGAWDNETAPRNESGQGLGSARTDRVFTGSNHNGTAKANRTLGTVSSTIGRLDNATAGPLSSDGGRTSTFPERFYGLSPVFTVAQGAHVTGMAVTSRPGDGGNVFKRGERIEVTATFSEPVEVQNADDGMRVVLMMNDGNPGSGVAEYLRMDHPLKLVFGLTVIAGYRDTNGLCIGTNCTDDSIRLVGNAHVVAASDGAAATLDYTAQNTSWQVNGTVTGPTGGVCDRQPAVRDDIVSKVSSANSCDEVADADVADIQQLDLSGKSIGSLRKEDFAGLETLISLDLSDNALSHLPEDLFTLVRAPRPILRTLDLEGNPLVSLPAGLFADMTFLRKVDLTDTEIATLPAGLFAGTALEELRLVEGVLTAFPGAALTGTGATLENVFLRDNRIATVPAGALDGMTALQELGLHNNRLTALPGGLFDDATDLRELRLDNNRLASLPNNLLRPLTQLEAVRLDSNPGFDDFAPAVAPIAAQTGRRGKRVDLEAATAASPWGDNVTWSWARTDTEGGTVTLNDDDTATPWFDAPVPATERTYEFTATARGRGMSGGNASEGAATAEVTVPRAAHIVSSSVTSRPLDGTNVFKRNDKIDITVEFSEAVRIEVITSTGIQLPVRIGTSNRFVNFHRSDHPRRATFRHTVGAGHVDANGFEYGGSGGIELLAGSIVAESDRTNANRSLARVNSGFNINGNVTTLTGGVCADGYHPEVLAAIVAAVPAASDCSGVTETRLGAIASLDLKGTSLETVHKRDFAGLDGLTELNLSQTALDHLPGDLFEHVSGLTLLKLNSNDIAALPGTLFAGLSALETLELRTNELAALPAGVFAGLAALETLDLQRNALTTLPAGVFAGLGALRRLDLADNELATLPNRVFEPLAQLESDGLGLGSNPGAADFVPAIDPIAAQTAAPAARVTLTAVAGANPWGTNLTWSWRQTDSTGETVTLEDADTRRARFEAPSPAVETELGFEVTATGRGTVDKGTPRRATAAAAVTVSDLAGPVPESASVPSGGGSVTLVFNEDLDVGSGLPPEDAFTVEADGAALTVQSVAEGTTAAALRLSLGAGAVGENQVVTVGYTAPETEKAIADGDGNRAEDFTGFAAVNNSTVANTTPPVPVSAEASAHDVIDLTFNETIDVTVGSAVLADAFTVNTGDPDADTEVPVNSAIHDNKLTGVHLLLPEGSIRNPWTVAVSYAAPMTDPPAVADTDGNAVADFTDFPVVNNSPLEGIAPELASATVPADGSSLLLVFSEALDNPGADTLPLPGAFAVEVDGAALAVQSVAAVGSGADLEEDRMRLVLPDGAIGARQVVSVGYTVPSGARLIVDKNGNPAKDFTTFSAVNDSTVANTTPPIPVSAVVASNGGTIVLTFNEEVSFSGNVALPATAFTLTVDDATVTVGAVARNDARPRNVTLFLSTGVLIERGQRVTVSYAVPETGAIVDADGNEAAAFDDFSNVTNNSTVDNTAPEPKRKDSWVGPGGDMLTIVFKEEDLDIAAARLPPASAFTFSVDDGADMDVSAVAAGAGPARLVLSLLAVVERGQKVTVTYTKPTSGPVIQDLAGNETATFMDFLVPNNSTVDTTAPDLETAVVGTAGNTLTLTFSEDLDTAATGLSPTSAFTVEADGAAVTVQSVVESSIGADTLILILSGAILKDDTVTVAYDADTGALADTAGNPLGHIANNHVAVVNNSTVEEGTPPPMLTCPADGHWDWEAALTPQHTALGTDTLFSFSLSANEGSLHPIVILPGGPTGFTVTNILRVESSLGTDTLAFSVSDRDGELPDGTIMNLGGMALTVGPGSNTTATGREQWNLGALGVSVDWPADEALAACANLPPRLASAVVDGTSLVLTYDQALDTDSVPALAAYSVSVNGTAAALSGVVLVSGRTVTLTLVEAVTGGQDATVTYTRLTSDLVQDGSGLPAPNIDGKTVDIVDDDPPEPVSAEVQVTGTSIVLTFDEALDLDAQSRIPGDAFTVEANGVEVEVTAGTQFSQNAVLLHLATAFAIKQGDTVTVSYEKPPGPLDPGDTFIADLAGNDAEDFEDYPVTNNSTVDGSPPEPESAEATAHNVIDLTFNETIDVTVGSAVLADAFTVTVNTGDPDADTEVPVNSAIHDNKLTGVHLLLPEGSIRNPWTVAVSYTAPMTDPPAVVDTAGNAVEDFTDFPVVNNSPLEGTAPDLDTAVVGTGGNTLTLTFSEDLDTAATGLSPASAFTVMAAGEAVTVQSVVESSIGADTLILILSGTILKDGTVTVAYDADTGALADTAGNPVGDIASDHVAVVNNSMVDETPPMQTCPADGHWDWEAALTPQHTVSGTDTLFSFSLSANEGSLHPIVILPGGPTGFTVTNILRVESSLGTDTLAFSVSDRDGEFPDGTIMNLGGMALTVGAGSNTTATGREQWNLGALGVSVDWPADEALAACANLPPRLASAVVDGTSLVLTYDQALDTDSVPALAAYSVSVNGTAALAEMDVSVMGRTVTLALVEAVTAGQNATVTYTRSLTSDLVQDGSGLPAPNIDGKTVDIVDDDPPEPVSAEVQVTGTSIVLTFDEALDLDAQSRIPGDAFTVEANGVEVEVTAGTQFSQNAVLLHLATAFAIKQGDTVTVSYEKPPGPLDPGDTFIADLAGNDAEDFDDYPVTNNSTVTADPGVTLSETALTVTEENTAGDSYTVVLATQPTANVTVTVSGYSGTEVTPSPDSLIFTASNWDTVQTVTVTADDDHPDVADDEVTLTHTASSTDTGYDGIAIDDVVVTVLDNDTAQVTGVALTPGNAQLQVEWNAVSNATGYFVQWKSGDQGYNSTRRATIDSGSTTSHTISSLTNGTEYTVRVRATRTGFNNGPNSTEVDGTPQGSNGPPTVENPIPDQNATAGTAFSYTFPANTFDDPDDDALTYAATESGSSTLPGWLDFDETDHTFSGTPKPADIGTVTVEVTATDEDGSGQSVSDSFDIAVRDPAVPALVLSETALEVEEGKSAPYKVALATRPTGRVTVTVSGYTGTDLTLTPNPARLVFTTGNWDMAQTVTVAAGEDPDEADDSATLEHTASGGGYGSVTADLPVTVLDNDGTNNRATGAPAIAGTAQVGMVLSADVSGIEDADSLSGAFDYQWVREDGAPGTHVGANSSTYAPVSADVGHGIRVEVSFTDAAGNAEGPLASVPTAAVEAAPDTGPLVLTVAAVKDQVVEGEPVRYRIVMSRATSGAMVESVFRYKGDFMSHNHSPTRVRTGVNSGHGPRANGTLYWEVEYPTLDDTEDEADGSFTVRLRKPPGDSYSQGEAYTLGTPSSATVTIRDDDDEGSVEDSLPIVSVEDAKVKEAAGAMLEFKATLDRAPRQEVRVKWETVDGGNRTGAKAGQDYVAANGTLVFRRGETAKTIRVEVLDDAHNEGDEVMLLMLLSAQGAVLDDTLMKGTIENSDPMPGAWITRFGRTASDHVVDAVAARWDDGRPERTHFTLGGRPLGGLFGGTGADGQDRRGPPDRRDGPFGTGPDSMAPGASPGGGAGRAPFGGGLGASGALPGVGQEMAGAGGPGVSGEAMNGAGGPMTAGAGGAPFGGASGAHSGAGQETPGVPGAPPGGAEGRSDRVLGGRAAQGALLRALGLPDPRGLRALLMGSSFFYSPARGGDAGSPGWLGEWSLWGRTAASRFKGADGALSLDGEVSTGLLGFDSRRDRWLAGLALSYSEGRGAYGHLPGGGGSVDSTLMGLHPYARFEWSERTSMWGVLGYGSGALSLVPERTGVEMEADLSHVMAAFGGRTALSVRTVGAGRFELAVRSDARWTDTRSAASAGLAFASGRTGRLRLMLEGSGSLSLGVGELRPRLEAGVRYDAGDAETGAGLEFAAGVGYASGPLEVQLDARGLLAHEDTGYEEWGFSGSVGYVASPDGRGLSMRLGSVWGMPQSGVRSLWDGPDASGLTRAGVFDAAHNYQAELSYGLEGRRGDALWSPYVGVDSGAGRALRAGVTVRSGRLDAGLELGRRQPTPGAPAEHAVALRGQLRW